MTDAAKDPKFRHLVAVLGRLWNEGFRGDAVVSMSGTGDLRIRLESNGEIREDGVPNLLVLKR